MQLPQHRVTGSIQCARSGRSRRNGAVHSRESANASEDGSRNWKIQHWFCNTSNVHARERGW